MKIEKKTLPEFFEKVLSGEKTFDLRLADWHCSPGDTILFREWRPETKTYTGREIEKNVGYILKTKDLELFSKEDVEKFGYQVISLL